jgi:hypothetical protein
MALTVLTDVTPCILLEISEGLTAFFFMAED